MRHTGSRLLLNAIVAITILASSLPTLTPANAQEQTRLYDLPAMLIRPSDIPSEPDLSAQRSTFGDYVYYAAVAKAISGADFVNFEKRMRRLGLLGYSAQLLAIASLPIDGINYRSQVWQFRDSDGAIDFFAQATNYDDEAGAESRTTIGDETTVVSTSYADDAGDGSWTRIYFRTGDVVAGLDVYGPQTTDRLSSKELFALARALLDRIDTVRNDDSATSAVVALRLRPTQWDSSDDDWSIGYYRKLAGDVVRQHYESPDDYASTVDYYASYNVESEFNIEEGFTANDDHLEYYVGLWSMTSEADAEAFYSNYIQPTGPDSPYQYAPIDATVDLGDTSDIFAVTYSPDDRPSTSGYNIVFRVGTVVISIEFRGNSATIDATKQIAGAQARCFTRARPCTPIAIDDILAD